MGQAGSTANCGCIESILTGSTKREQFLEQQCTELARQNELLRNRLEQSSRSVDAASPNLNLSRQSSGNHHRKSLSAYKSLGGSSGNLAAAAAPSTANLSSVAEGSPGGRADTAANRRRSERSSSKMEQGQLATLAVTAAAQEAADYQSSLVSVSINNEAYETKTEVTNPDPEPEPEPDPEPEPEPEPELEPGPEPELGDRARAQSRAAARGHERRALGARAARARRAIHLRRPE
jgi:hypothetical protein